MNDFDITYDHEDCRLCVQAGESAASLARVTGSIASTETIVSGDRTEHRATARRVLIDGEEPDFTLTRHAHPSEIVDPGEEMCREPNGLGCVCTRKVGHTAWHAAGDGDVIVAKWN